MASTTHPRALYTLTFAEAWGRFNYYGTQMILVIYFTKIFLFSNSESFAIYGAFASFSYALPIVGGIIADKLIGSYRALVIGGIAFVIANLLLSFSQPTLFCIGLGLNALGTGLFKSNCTSLVGSLYPPADSKRTRGYTIFYMGLNIGATVGPIIYGVTSQYLGWNYCFYITALGSFTSLIFIILEKQSLIKAAPLPAESVLKLKVFSFFKLKWLIYLLLLMIGLILSIPFLYPYSINFLLACFALLITIAVFCLAFKHNKEERRRIAAIFILSIFGMLFFSASLQVGSSLIVFINHNIQRDVLGWQIPTVMFTSLYPLAVVATAPFISALWHKLDKHNLDPSAPYKLIYGLILAGIAFIVFAITAYYSYPQYNHYYALALIVLGNLLLGSGELVLSPAVFTAINVLAPDSLKSSMAGLWFLFVALGGYMSGIIADISTSTIQLTSSNLGLVKFEHAFLAISIGIFIVSFILFLFLPVIKNLSGDIKLK